MRSIAPLTPEALRAKAARFNRRPEIRWFGFEGAFDADGGAVVRMTACPEGMLGGGGTDAVNGGVVSAGFDAVAVLAALGAYPTDTIATATLDIQFHALAMAGPGLTFAARVEKAGRRMAFVSAELVAGPVRFARAQASLVPIDR